MPDKLPSPNTSLEEGGCGLWQLIKQNYATKKRKQVKMQVVPPAEWGVAQGRLPAGNCIGYRRLLLCQTAASKPGLALGSLGPFSGLRPPVVPHRVS